MHRAETVWTVSLLNVCFLDGTKTQHAAVQLQAPAWSDYANIKFVFGTTPAKSHIRITFHGPSGYSHSSIGTDALSIAQKSPTMQLSQLTPNLPQSKWRGVILHEFGHALGLEHELENPACPIKLDPSAPVHWLTQNVYDYFDPYGLTPEDVNQQVFAQFSESTDHTPFDAQSIMIYPILKGWASNGYVHDMNVELSDTDKVFISSMYPKSKPM